MESDIPKQFLLLNGKPIIFHTIQKFLEFDPEIELVLVLPEFQLDLWKKLCEEFHFNSVHQCVIGGKERFDSVKNGIGYCTGDIIAVHDAVRPLVSVDVISNCFRIANEKGAAVPVVPINESIRKISNGTSSHRNRDDYRIVQTPQCFKKDILVEAYNQEYQESFTDDASVVENIGYSIFLVDGNQENIKITRSVDMLIAEKLIE